MEVVQLYKCDTCQKVIENPEHGRVVHGNIYVADPTTCGGMVGNNFPEDTGFSDPPAQHPFKFTADQVNKNVFCIPCFLKVVLPDTKLTATRKDYI